MEIVIICSLVLGVLILHKPLSYFFHRLYIRRQAKKFTSKETFYHSVVCGRLKYYNRLGLEDQHKFLFRTFLFHKSKRFHYIEVNETAEMPILISAVAVQLTFGLEKFLFNYFDDIYVIRDDYHYGVYSRPFQGHVDQTGIYLSWDNFNKGIAGLAPNCNIGLHEMAHALAYVNFITQTDEDRHFKREFNNFSKVARPVFADMQNGHKNLLGEYAGTNYHEFWAVAVEIFFENPVKFRHELPELYLSMTRVLNQNPLDFTQGRMTIIKKHVLKAV
ncbi:MAG: zinc-dependent peptidase [Bacteroidetes bacterium]|nr:zinc-dependent peptidase [Bacteroidota bacterium]